MPTPTTRMTQASRNAVLACAESLLLPPCLRPTPLQLQRSLEIPPESASKQARLQVLRRPVRPGPLASPLRLLARHLRLGRRDSRILPTLQVQLRTARSKSPPSFQARQQNVPCSAHRHLASPPVSFLPLLPQPLRNPLMEPFLALQKWVLFSTSSVCAPLWTSKISFSKK